ncbi:alpha/beta-hydrolase [Daedaleopsis nitida]|nr:alpha/beta-hydrolase [Daedaleopsis nitida]
MSANLSSFLSAITTSPTIQCSLLAAPAVLVLASRLIAYTPAPHAPRIHSSLATLPKSSRSWSLYPDTYYEGGAYARLPYGSVRYWLIGPEGGKRVVLIHGLTIPAIIWKDVVPELAAEGYRVLVYDVYGRGYSDAPHTTYDASLYITQLALLLQHVGWINANIVGVSMGGAIATAFAAQFPNLVDDKVVLIASVGLYESSDLPWRFKFNASPLMQFVKSSYAYRLYLQYRATQQVPSDDPISELVRIQSAYLPGFNRAVASTVRDGPLRNLAPQFAALGRQSRKTGGRVLLIWGTNDEDVPYHFTSRLKALIPHAELVAIDGGPHDITLSHGHEVSRALVEFLG